MPDLTDYNVPDGMPLAVWQNKYARRKPDGSFQSWPERLFEVVNGNFSLSQKTFDLDEYRRTLELAGTGIFATSGRHLQHGDKGQKDRLLELHSNCSTTVFSFVLFRLLLRGSGVGRDYSAAACRVDWSLMPDVRLVLDESHPDFKADIFRNFMEPLRDARHKYDSESERVRWFEVQDSREGWSKVVEILETAAWQGKHANKLFVFDFSKVRPAGAPIAGLQGRPASGPIALMNAIAQVASIKAAGMKPWKQALFVDHYLASCVQLGGARRAARMAVKSWRDRDVMEFIDIKRGGHLWSANNSLSVDAEFWEQAKQPQHTYARRVFEAAANAAYFDGTGEPGFINVDKLTATTDGFDTIGGDTCINPETYGDLHPKTMEMIGNVVSHVKKFRYPFIVNPCAEIVLATYGGLCLIGDVNLSRVTKLEDALDAVGLMAKFLIRCNLMQSEYAAEVKRTNRIGVSLTGIHEFAWNMFGLTFGDMVSYSFGATSMNENSLRDEPSVAHHAHEFWTFMNEMRERVERDAAEFSEKVGLPAPHTATCIKPSGTVSKVLNCTEGAHLPALAYYLRWVQYKQGDAAVLELVGRGYPMKDVSDRYPGHVVIGFPTRQPIADLMGEHVTCTDEVSVEDNFRWLMLLENHWIGPPGKGNMVSYTLKYDATKVSYQQFMDVLLEWQPQIRCCAVMPSSDWRESEKVYGYVPEQPISKLEYDVMMARISAPARLEAYDDDALACAGGVCPIEEDRN